MDGNGGMRTVIEVESGATGGFAALADSFFGFVALGSRSIDEPGSLSTDVGGSLSTETGAG
jgi:hypothetical protein